MSVCVCRACACVCVPGAQEEEEGQGSVAFLFSAAFVFASFASYTYTYDYTMCFRNYGTCIFLSEAEWRRNRHEEEASGQSRAQVAKSSGGSATL